MHAAAAPAATTECMRACVVVRVTDTMYQLIYSSAQTKAWRIEFPYRNIHEYWGRSKGRVGGAHAWPKCTFGFGWPNMPVLTINLLKTFT
jgi:hypothetical protein